MAHSGTDDLMPHFIFCIGSTYHSVGHASRKIKKMFLKKMREYRIQPSILTMLNMHRIELITKEKSKLAAEGKLKNTPGWRMFEGSINEDLDSFIDNFQNSNEVVRGGIIFGAEKCLKEFRTTCLI